MSRIGSIDPLTLRSHYEVIVGPASASALACCDHGGTQVIWGDRLAQHPLISSSTHKHWRIAAHDHIWNALLLEHTLERAAVVVAQDVVDNSSIDTALTHAMDGLRHRTRGRDHLGTRGRTQPEPPLTDHGRIVAALAYETTP